MRRKLFWWLFAKEIGKISCGDADLLNCAIDAWDVMAENRDARAIPKNLKIDDVQIRKLRLQLYLLRVKIMKMMEGK
jgi:hypothetical protein